VTGLTFDTGALIALERRKLRMRQVLERARDRDQLITVPTDVVAEWWRGATDIRSAILDSVDIEPLTLRLAQIAGEAMGAVPGATLVDAIVMASAASRGDIIYSSDVHDLERIRRVFPSVRILGT
jgi:predicted nucleic acid-binding protein